MSDFPYPGLRPFHRDEVDIFFGRDEQIDQLLARLDKKRFLAVVGPSGCGKSSLVQTGLLNALETGFLASAGVRWRMATLRPGNHPLRNLARALLEKEALGPERSGDENSEAFLLATLRRGPLGLVEIRREVALPPNTNLLVLVDQFEEIFRYRQQYDINEADAFVALLLASAAQPEARLYVLLTMRSDFLGDCTLFAGLPEALNDSQFLTPRLTREQLQEAITGPARVFGGDVEPALVNRLLNDMGTDPDQLPLMQHALMRLWNRASRQSPVLLTLRDYEAIGGLKEALSRHADEAYEQLDDTQKAIAETLFRSLCERSAARRDTRRPVRLENAAAVAGVQWEQVAAVVEAFRHPNRSFLMPPVGTPLKPDTIIDISHESLIRQWQRLSDWVEAEAKSAERYLFLVATARYWQQGKAALWHKPDLDIALAWRETQQPNLAWAQRYGGDFELAMEFLDESQREHERELQKEETDRQRELDILREREEIQRMRAEEQAKSAKRSRNQALWATVVAGAFGLLLVAIGILWYNKIMGFNMKHATSWLFDKFGCYQVDEPKHATSWLLDKFGCYRVDKPKMVRIPAGKFFWMGSCDDDPTPPPKSEIPCHEVTFSKPFEIGQYEVTFEEYDQFAYATWRQRPHDSNWGRGRRPVIRVTWDNAVAYARWLSSETGNKYTYRLPTEAEWEYAARAGSETSRFWGHDPKQACQYANVADQSLRQFGYNDVEIFECDDQYAETTAEIGSFKPNQFGLYDMMGNVEEWVKDCYHDDYRGAPPDGSSWDTQKCSYRIARGGSWNQGPLGVRAAMRDKNKPDYRDSNLGFRLAKDVTD